MQYLGRLNTSGLEELTLYLAPVFSIRVFNKKITRAARPQHGGVPAARTASFTQPQSKLGAIKLVPTGH